MKVEQVYNILNTITGEILGESVVVAEDLSNVVDIGRAFQNLSGAVDNYVRRLPDMIGKIIFVDRLYSGRAPRVVRDGWEYGSILGKYRTALPKAEENETWSLQDGTIYSNEQFYKPDVSVKFYNDRVTFDIPISITDEQVKSSFRSAEQLNAFYSMIATAIQNSITVKLDALIMRTINSFIGETLYDAFPGGTYSGATSTKAVNLLYLYNTTVNAGGTAITAAQAMTDPAFLRFAAYTIKNYIGRIKDMSVLFNIEGTEKFTPLDRMNVVLLNEFKNAAEVYLYDGLNQFSNTELNFTDNVETVAFWQGSGTGYAFTDTGAINITTPGGHAISASGILGVIFDRDALGVANLNRNTTTAYNAKAQFYNEFHHVTAGYWLDMAENFVTFYVA